MFFKNKICFQTNKALISMLFNISWTLRSRFMTTILDKKISCYFNHYISKKKKTKKNIIKIKKL